MTLRNVQAGEAREPALGEVAELVLCGGEEEDVVLACDPPPAGGCARHLADDAQ